MASPRFLGFRWEHHNELRIATVSIAINSVQTATEGDIVCTTELDRRNRRPIARRGQDARKS